jgi:hypothetical protein
VAQGAAKLGQIASCGRGSELAIRKINFLPSRDRRESIRINSF